MANPVRFGGWRRKVGDTPGKKVRAHLGNMGDNDIVLLDGSASSAATGLSVTSAAAASGLALAVTSSGNNENLKVDAKGSGTIAIGSVSTGAVTITPAVTLTGNPTLTGKITTYNGVATAGMGTAPIYGSTKQRAVTTTADANLLTVTPAAAAGTYRVTVAATVTSATSGVVSFTVAYKDAAGASVSDVTVPLNILASATVSIAVTTSAASRYSGSFVIDVDNSATAIVIKWVGGGTLAGFASASIEQLA